MHTKRRAALIETLAQGVERVGPEFERFAGIVMGARSDVRLTHAGVNLRGYPVAGVVDSESDDGREVVEYSDRRNYFDGMMAKAEDDLRKVLADRPTARQIYLVAGERARPQKVADFKTRVLAWPQMAGKALTFFGSEEIATEIVDRLMLDERLIGQLTPYLADLQRIVDEEAAAALVPSLPFETLARPEVDSEIGARLAVHPVLTIAGMGGLGKSIAAMSYADAHRSAYQMRIWLDGEEVKRAESLRAFPLVRAGDPRNIASLLETGGCLLVIDDARQDLSIEALTKFCGDGSHIILTCRLARPGAYEPPLLTQDEARAMLDAPGAPCPPTVFETIWASVNGYPLCLSLLRATARSGVPWPDLAQDCGTIGKILDDDGVRLVDRLLQRLKDQLQQELCVFVWAGLPAIDKAFLTREVAPVGIRNLSAYGLTSVDRGGVVRLHDVVFAALKSLDWCSAARSTELDRALQAFIIKVADEPGLRLWTLVRTMMPKLEAMVTSGVDDGPCRYALLVVWEANEVRRELIEDPLAAAARLTAGPGGPLAVITVIETVEQLFLLDKHEGERVARERLEERMPVFAALAGLPALTSRERAQIQHHEGKALKRLGKLDEAAKRFEVVLAGPYPMDEARLQLVTIYRSKPEKTTETIALVDQVFARWGAGEDVSYSVILGLIERLPAGEGRWRNEIIAHHAEAIKTTIIEAANQGIGQAVQAFAPLGRFISTEMPELFMDIFQQIPTPVLEGLGVDGDRFAWAEIYAEAAKVPEADAPALRAKALRFYEAMVKPDDFNVQRRAEVLIEIGRATEAEALLLHLLSRKSNEWVERLLARTRLALGDPAGALERISKALTLLKAEHFRSEFLQLRFDIRKALGDARAGDDLEAALGASQKAAEGRRLALRLAVHRGDQARRQK